MRDDDWWYVEPDEEPDEDVWLRDHLHWMNHINKIEKTPDENGKVVLTNFDNEKNEDL